MKGRRLVDMLPCLFLQVVIVLYCGHSCKPIGAGQTAANSIQRPPRRQLPALPPPAAPAAASPRRMMALRHHAKSLL